MWAFWEKIWLTVCNCHRSDDGTAGGVLRNFLLPRFTRGFFLRVAVITAGAVALFSFLLIPCVISGASMEPTIHSRGLTFCWRGQYWWGKNPLRGDIVVIKNTPKVFFLKRIVGLPGETVEFRDGELFIDGRKQKEPYVKFVSTWNMAPRKIESGNYYVIGDNRSMPIDQHKFGQVPAGRIIGVPLW